MDAIDILELNQASAEELEKIELGMLKQNMMWWFNKIGFGFFGVLLYKGRLLERNKLHSLGIMRTITFFTIGLYYLQFGDYLASCCLWGEIRYIFIKYEPIIRERRIERNAFFVHMEGFKNRASYAPRGINLKELYNVKD